MLTVYLPLRRKFAGGGNTMSIVGSALGGVSSILDSAMQNAQIADTSAIESTMDNAGKNVEASSLDSLMEQWGATSNFGNQTSWRDVRGMSGGEMAGNILGAGLSGASAGAAAGPWGAIIGGAAGLLGSGIGAAVGNQKARNKAAELNEMANEANLRQQLAFSSNAQSIMNQQNLANMSTLFSKGGKIYIKPSKRGTFTAAAKKRGMGVQEFASKVLANRSNYSPAMVKKANFARNFGGRKNAEGGFLPDWDDTEIGKMINYVENRDSVGFDAVNRRWYAPPKGKGYDRNNRGMGVDILVNPHIRGKVKLDKRGSYLTEEDERQARFKSISDAEKSYERRLKHAMKVTGITDSPSERKKALTVSAIYNLGSGFVANNLFEDKELMRALMSGTDEEYANQVHKYYKQKGRNERITLENEFLGLKAMGGNLSTHGGEFSNGITQINNGDTHEQNPMEGVPMGIAPDGLPNLVEEGEVIFNDYVFSNRLKPKKETLKASGLKGYKNKTFAQIAKDLQKESEERPNDPISKRGLEDSMTKLATVQEDMRQRRNDNKYPDGGSFPEIIFGPDGYTRRLFAVPEYDISYDLNEYFDTGNADDRMRDILMTPLPKDNSSGATDDTDTMGDTWLRYAPAVGSVIGSLVSAFSKPDYEHSNTILNELNRQRPRGVRFKPVSNYMRYNPLNTSYLMNRLGAETAASRRALENTGGGNAGAVRNSLIGLNRSAQDALGDAYLKAEQYNDNLMRQVEEFNRGTNMFNSQGAMRADTYNSGLQNTYDARRLSTIGTIAGMREAADAALEQNRSMNFTGLFDNIGEIGRENFIFNQIRNNPAYRYYTDNSGNTIYKGKYGGMLTKRNRKRRRG